MRLVCWIFFRFLIKFVVMLTKKNPQDQLLLNNGIKKYVWIIKSVYAVLKPVNTFSVPAGSLIIVHIFAAEEAAWRTNQKPYQKGIRMGSSPTFTVATENRWPSRSIQQPSWEEGTDRELKTKDVDLLICSADKTAPNCPSMCTFSPKIKVILI